MVVFRLTQEEYACLSDACKTKGGRNLSEFTRSELLAMLHSEPATTAIQDRFDRLEQRLGQFESAIERLTEFVAPGPHPGASPVRRATPRGTEQSL
jgi:cob(I)alamin adenosyltransferase